MKTKNKHKITFIHNPFGDAKFPYTKDFYCDSHIKLSEKIFQYMLLDKKACDKNFTKVIWNMNPDETLIEWVVADCDNGIPHGIPEPTYITKTSDNHYHLYYKLKSPIPKDKYNNQKVQVFSARVKGDPRYKANNSLRVPNTISSDGESLVEWIKTNGPEYDAAELLSCNISQNLVKPSYIKSKRCIEYDVEIKLQKKQDKLKKHKQKEQKKETPSAKQQEISRCIAKSNLVSSYKDKFKKTNPFNQKILPLVAGMRNSTLLLVSRYNYRGINDDDSIKSLLDQCYSHPYTTTSTPVEESFTELKSMIGKMWSTYDPSKETGRYKTFDLADCDIDADDEFNSIENPILRMVMRCINHAIVYGKGFLSQGLISKRIGYAKATVSRAIKSLIAQNKLRLDKEKYNNDPTTYKAHYYDIIRKEIKEEAESSREILLSPLSFCVSFNEAVIDEEDLFEITRIDEKPPDPGPPIDFGEIPRLAEDQEIIQLNDEARQLAGLVYDEDE